MNKDFQLIYDRFDAIDERFNKVDECFDAVYERIDLSEERTDERLVAINQRFFDMEYVIIQTEARLMKQFEKIRIEIKEENCLLIAPIERMLDRLNQERIEMKKVDERQEKDIQLIKKELAIL